MVGRAAPDRQIGDVASVRAPSIGARRSRSVHRRKIDDGVVDTVEDVGEHGDSDREADFDELAIGIACRADRIEFALGDRAARGRQQLDETDQCVALR